MTRGFPLQDQGPGMNELFHDLAVEQEERLSRRPSGSNADEWHLFLTRYCDNRATQPNGLTFIAVQIAEAIDAAEQRGKTPCGECHLQTGERCDICGKQAT